MSYINIFAQAPAAEAAAASSTPVEATAATAATAQTGTIQPASSGSESPAVREEGSEWGTFITFGLIIVVFYFLLIRPQQKQQKELKASQDALKAGDEVITAGVFTARFAISKTMQ